MDFCSIRMVDHGILSFKLTDKIFMAIEPNYPLSNLSIPSWLGYNLLNLDSKGGDLRSLPWEEQKVRMDEMLSRLQRERKEV